MRSRSSSCHYFSVHTAVVLGDHQNRISGVDVTVGRKDTGIATQIQRVSPGTAHRALSIGSPRELKETQAVLAMGLAAVTPVVHSGDIAMLTCVFGGAPPGCRTRTSRQWTWHSRRRRSPRRAIVLSQVCRTKVFAPRSTMTRERVNCEDARIFASPTRCRTPSASRLSRLDFSEVSVIGTTIALTMPMRPTTNISSMSEYPCSRTFDIPLAVQSNSQAEKARKNRLLCELRDFRRTCHF